MRVRCASRSEQVDRAYCTRHGRVIKVFFAYTRRNRGRSETVMKQALVYLAVAVSIFAQTGAKLIDAPRIWNDRDLSDWATPVAGLNVRPGHFSEKEYY